eukprot:3784031-Rhodomonas_salina.2
MLDLARELDAFVGDACGAEGVLMTDQEQKFVFMNNQRIYRTRSPSSPLSRALVLRSGPRSRLSSLLAHSRRRCCLSLLSTSSSLLSTPGSILTCGRCSCYSAISGAVIGVAIAFVVLCLAT